MTRDYTCFFISELKENSTGNYEESEVEETDSVWRMEGFDIITLPLTIFITMIGFTIE